MRSMTYVFGELCLISVLKPDTAVAGMFHCHFGPSNTRLP